MIAVVLINLDKDVARLDWMSRQTRDHGLTFDRFRALSPEDFTPDQRAYAQSPQRAAMRPGEIGCLASHIAVWRRIVESGRTTLILEDDVHFARDFGDFIRALRVDDDEICIHRLETFLPRVSVARTPRFKLGKRAAYVLLTNHGGGAAYILNPPTARALLGLIDAFQNNVDVELFDPDRGAASGMRIYQWIPAPCIQDQWLPARRALGLGSNIVERADIASGVYAPRPEPLKDALRPLYTALYDLALAPSGKSRKYVPYG